MDLITNTTELEAFCERMADESYITVDTEFMREKTYWPQLCLVQIGGTNEASCIDVLEDGIDLGPLYELMANENVLKVFHAARQDVEIFVKHTGQTPTPMFDTQIAGMVCGFGESVGYEVLVNSLAKKNLDKGSRFTDWSKRPLTERQITYALGDVTHLRVVYDKLKAMLDESNRYVWLEEEMQTLCNTQTYIVDPNEVYKRIKVRSKEARVLAVLRELGAWREHEAQGKNIPRNRVIRDESLIEIAHHIPKQISDLERVRGLGKGMANGRYGREIMAAVEKAMALDKKDYPLVPRKKDIPKGIGPVMDLLKVLLKLVCEENDVAQKLIANSADLEQLAAFGEKADVNCLSGWRKDVFGNQALKLINGQIGLIIDGKNIRVIEAQ